jgi:hypothetical protein
MALTATTHKIAQSVSGTTFTVYTDGTNVVQAVLPLPGTYTNLLASSAGEMAAARVLHRIALNAPAAGAIAIFDGANPIATIALGTVPCSLEYGCAVSTGINVTCVGAEDLTVIWS